ncbi:ankyrin repeat-containing domain protein [Leptodontidium sp. 2 PMI_412]|nr:ankyrin repeat-containing domain protein [Leptodontidium sp. 2 PMI_412]
MPPYYPPTTQACFHYNYLAHDRGILCSDDYLNRMLAHLSGVRHPEDKSTMTLSDPLSMVFHACTEQLDTVIIEGTSSIKKLVLDSWFGETEVVTVQTPLVLGSLEPYGISTNMYEGLLCIACMTGRIKLLNYFLSLDNYLVRLAGSKLRPLQSAISRTYPDVTMWSILLGRGLYLQERGSKFDPTYSPPADGIYPGLDFNSWADKALSPRLPATELLDFLIARGFVVTENFFHSAVSKMNLEFVRWLLTKCEPNSFTGLILFFATSNSPQMVDMILDTGVDVNLRDRPGFDDPFRPMPGYRTALHQAAERGRADIVKLLLERGAHKSLKDSWSQTAKDLAANPLQPFPEIVDLIHNFVPSSERYILPPVAEETPLVPTIVEMSKGKYWKFLEKSQTANL